jgi:hypothetical protein
MSKTTVFGEYLESHGIPAADAAKDLKTTKSYIHMLATGVCTPAAKLCYRIEVWSKGAVTMQSWFAKPAKKLAARPGGREAGAGA